MAGARPGLPPPEASFTDALASYRAARYSEAFGRLVPLAAAGDADAARIVLFMHQYGPMLYGSYWDLNGEQVAVFREVATLASARPQPVFRPSWDRPRVPAGKPRNVAAAGSR